VFETDKEKEWAKEKTWGISNELKETLDCFIFIIKTGAYWMVKGF